MGRLRTKTLQQAMAFILASAFTCAASAQQTSSPTQQTRPRRVSDGTGQSKPQEVGDDEVVRVETDLVTVPVVVRDRTGRPVTTLRPENFQIYEDGRPQRIANFSTTDAPFEVALLLDTSGSTRADLELIRRAAQSFIAALRPFDRVAVLAFKKDADDPFALATVEVAAPLTSDRERLQRAIEALSTSDGTPFYDSLVRVAGEVFAEPPREEVRGRRALVALTDGVDSTSEADFAQARAALLRQGIICYFVQINTEEFVENRLLRDCADDGTLQLSRTQLRRYRQLFLPTADADAYADFCRLGPFQRMQISRALYELARREMRELARATGGQTFPVAELRDAQRAFAQVASEIGKQYSLGYYSTNKARDGRFRVIRIEVKGIAGAQVSAREGYYAPKG